MRNPITSEQCVYDGDIYYDGGLFDRAIESYIAAAYHRQGHHNLLADPRYHLRKANAYARIGSLEESASAFIDALEAAKDDCVAQAQIYFDRAKRYIEWEEYVLAFYDLNEVRFLLAQLPATEFTPTIDELVSIKLEYVNTKVNLSKFIGLFPKLGQTGLALSEPMAEVAQPYFEPAELEPEFAD